MMKVRARLKMPIKKKANGDPQNGVKQIIEDVENDIRDLINWIEVCNEEDTIDDKVTSDLTAKLKKIAAKLGISTLGE